MTLSGYRPAKTKGYVQTAETGLPRQGMRDDGEGLAPLEETTEAVRLGPSGFAVTAISVLVSVVKAGKYATTTQAFKPPESRCVGRQEGNVVWY